LRNARIGKILGIFTQNLSGHRHLTDIPGETMLRNTVT
jgi:hypothetical protein